MKNTVVSKFGRTMTVEVSDQNVDHDELHKVLSNSLFSADVEQYLEYVLSVDDSDDNIVKVFGPMLTPKYSPETLRDLITIIPNLDVGTLWAVISGMLDPDKFYALAENKNTQANGGQ